MRLASSEAMLVQGGMGAKPGRLRRLWLETLWGLSVHYLRHNLIRSLRVRLSRVQWWYQRRVVGPRGGDR